MPRRAYMLSFTPRMHAAAVLSSHSLSVNDGGMQASPGSQASPRRGAFDGVISQGRAASKLLRLPLPMASVEGWLFKLGGGASEGGLKSARWNKRYFVLRGHLLCYYAKEEGARGVAWQTPSGVVRADKVMLHDEWGDDASDDNHAKWQFALAHPDGDNLVLAAMTRPEREKWVAALEACGSGPQRAAAAKAQAELEAAQAAAKEARAAAKAERPAPAAADADAE